MFSQTTENNIPNIPNGQEQEKKLVRILIVDDDPDILGTFKAGLNDSDLVKSVFGPEIELSVDTYTKPKSALSDFKAGAYDLILLDIKMPEMNGFELYEELVKVDEKPKICFITAYETYYEVLKKDFPELDVGCFIKKPILTSDLAKRIKEVLEH